MFTPRLVRSSQDLEVHLPTCLLHKATPASQSGKSLPWPLLTFPSTSSPWLIVSIKRRLEHLTPLRALHVEQTVRQMGA